MGKRGPLAGTNKREAPTGIRFDPDLRARLEGARKVSGRSFSEEVSSRLRSSFGSVQTDDAVTQGLAAQIAHALDIIHEDENHAWHETQRCWLFACHAILDVLSRFEPGGDTNVPDDHPALVPLISRGLPHFVIAETREELESELIEPGAGDRQLGRSTVGERAARIAVAVYEARADASDLVIQKIRARDESGTALCDLKRAPDVRSQLAASFIENPPTDKEAEEAAYNEAREKARKNLSNTRKTPPKGDNHDQ